MVKIILKLYIQRKALMCLVFEKMKVKQRMKKIREVQETEKKNINTLTEI